MFNFEGSRQEFLTILAELGEEPAFVTRAKATEQGLERLLSACGQKYAELQEWPRRHFTGLRNRVRGDWGDLCELIVDDDASSIFDNLSSALPELAPWDSPLFATSRSLLKAFLESADRFNRKWELFLNDVDLETVNRVRDEYNRYYPIERAAALGTERVNIGFRELPMLKRSFLAERFPLLQLPTMR
jgi:hypothetical protein